MTKAAVVTRVIDFQDFQVPVIVGVYDSLSEAQQAAKLMTAALQDMVRCRLVRKGPDGAQIDMDGSVGDMLVEMGIVGFQHHVREYGVRTNSLIEVPQPTLVVPR